MLCCAALSCASNPVQPEPNLTIAPAAERRVLNELESVLRLNHAIAEKALRRPAMSELVDAQLRAMQQLTEGRVRPAPDAPPKLLDLRELPSGDAYLERLSVGAALLTQWLPFETGEAELGHAAIAALAKTLGDDAEWHEQHDEPNVSVDFSPELHGRVGVLRLRHLAEGIHDRILNAFNQWSASQHPPKAIVLDVSECTAGAPREAAKLVNTFAPGRLAFSMEYRENQTLQRATLRAEPAWGTPELAQAPLAIWVSSRTDSFAEAVAHALKRHRSATIVGAMTAGDGRAMLFQPLYDGSWFAFTRGELIDVDGRPLRGQRLIPEACSVAGELVPLRERSPESYAQQCGVEEQPLSVGAVVRYAGALLQQAAQPAAGDGPGWSKGGAEET